MSEQLRPFLPLREVVPAFVLPGPDGMPHGPWDYKQRENLALVFLATAASAEARVLLAAWKQQYYELRMEECAALVVTADPVIVHTQVQEELQLPFPLLADPRGTVIERYTRRTEDAGVLLPSVALTNRFGVLQAQWIAESVAGLPAIQLLLEELRYLNNLCNP
jgi:peroxiredoxin